MQHLWIYTVKPCVPIVDKCDELSPPITSKQKKLTACFTVAMSTIYTQNRGTYNKSVVVNRYLKTSRGFKVFYNRRYFLNFRRYLKN